MIHYRYKVEEVRREYKPLRIQIYKSHILFADDAGPPPSTVINQNETFARVLFKPSVIQQAKIAQNGVLGDFIVRYDVKRAQSIGDVQVRGSLLLFPVSCLICLVGLRTGDCDASLREMGLSDSWEIYFYPKCDSKEPRGVPLLGADDVSFLPLQSGKQMNL